MELWLTEHDQWFCELNQSGRVRDQNQKENRIVGGLKNYRFIFFQNVTALTRVFLKLGSIPTTRFFSVDVQPATAAVD
jgi:hypothetical protein